MKSIVKSRRFLIVLLILVLVAVGAWFAYQNSQAQKEVERLSNPTESAKQANAELVQKVGLLTELPAGETPTVATVTDASKLKKQAFFAQAENGDKVLIFTQAKKAYLYRPSTNKIIEIAPVNIGSSSQSSSSQSSQSSQSTQQ